MMSRKLSLGDKQFEQPVESGSGSASRPVPREQPRLTLGDLPPDIVEDHIVPAAKALGGGEVASLGSTGKHLHAQVMRSTTVPLAVAIRSQLSLSQVPSLPAELAVEQAAMAVRPASGNFGESLYALRRLEELFALRGHKASCPTPSHVSTQHETCNLTQIETALQMVLDGPSTGRLEFPGGLSEALQAFRMTIMQPLLRWKTAELNAQEARIGYRTSVHFDAAIDAIVKNAERQEQNFVFRGVGTSTLPPFWLYSKHVVSLELEFSSARGFSLPAEICQLDKLTTLHLDGAQVDESVSDALSELVGLKSLKLSDCPKLELTGRFSNLKNLESLDLSGNRLRVVPSALSKLTNLKNLDLSYNGISRVGDTLDRLQNLELLDLKYNVLTDFDIGADGLGSLIKLDLYCNNLRIFPSQVFSCSNLEHLNLTRNSIEEVPSALGSLEKLEHLDLSSNQIVRLGAGLGECHALTKLNLADNFIGSIPAEFGMLQNLRFLDISSALGNEIPKALVKTSALTTLKISHEIARENVEAFEEKFRATCKREAPEIIQNQPLTMDAYISMFGFAF